MGQFLGKISMINPKNHVLNFTYFNQLWVGSSLYGYVIWRQYSDM
jgi:hypothetical protein